MKYLNYCVILLILLMVNLRGQPKSYEQPSPVIGWDSLSNKILYPEIYRRTGVQGIYIVKLYIDSIGVLDKMTVREFNKNEILDSNDAIVNSFNWNLKSIKWLPGKVDGRNVGSQIKIPIVLILSDSNSTKAIIKMKSFPSIQKDSGPYRGKP